MRKISIIVFLIPFLIVNGCGNSNDLKPVIEIPYTEVSGSITTDAMWDVAHSPYIFTGDVTIERDATLTIEPNVEVRFDKGFSLIVKGVLIVEGKSKNQIITFTSNLPLPEMGDWKGIYFDNTNDSKSILRYVKIEYAQRALDVFSSSPQVMDCIITQNHTGIYAANMHSSISYSLISDNIYGMIFKRQPVPEISNNIIQRNEIGITSHLSLVVRNNNFLGNLKYAIDFQYRSQFYTRRIDARYNWWGTTDTKRIEEQIYHFFDNPMLHKVQYIPFATSKIVDAGCR